MSAQLKLSPYGRVISTINHEMDLGGNPMFGPKRYDDYLQTAQKISTKRDRLLLQVVILNSLVYLLLAGQEAEVLSPYKWILELPGSLEVATFAAALVYMFAGMALFNSVCYNLIVSQFNLRLAQEKSVDPDFLDASETEFQFPIKVFAETFNNYGVDFYSPRGAYRALSRLIRFTSSAAILVFPVVHLVLFSQSVFATYSNTGANLLTVSYFCAILCANLCGFLHFVCGNWQFKFGVLETKQTDTSNEKVAKEVNEA